jgi:short-subunit dehydrogenase
MTKNRYVLITGASSGIGACFARRFWAEGYSLILVARREERLQELKAELCASGNCHGAQDVMVIPTDLGKTEHVEALFEKIRDKRLFIFINNAGFGDCGNFCDTDAGKDMSMIDVNVKAMHLAMKLALGRMQKQGNGYILNVASSAGLLPGGPYMATYYATKAYVASLTRAVACELRESGSHIYVGALCPGPVDTEFNSVANVEFALKGISAEACVDYAVAQMKKRKTVIIPTNRIKLAIFGGKIFPDKLVVRMTAHQQRKKLTQTQKTSAFFRGII